MTQPCNSGLQYSARKITNAGAPPRQARLNDLGSKKNNNMRHYKVYSLDRTGRIALAQDVECRDDLDALAWAEHAASREVLEVWQGARLVARVKPGNAPLDSQDRTSL